MSLTKEKKVELLVKFRQHEMDTGSPEVQIALITTRINELNDHFKEHKKDHHSRLGLLRLIGQRRRLLNYLKNKSLDRYQNLIKELNLRK
ncbi:MAG: 30S ribosomal protein S15 [Spirochaetota bacterium]|nr:30S ribosomal protein S15 [Spirochaetota bacterium]